MHGKVDHWSSRRLKINQLDATGNKTNQLKQTRFKLVHLSILLVNEFILLFLKKGSIMILWTSQKWSLEIAQATPKNKQEI